MREFKKKRRVLQAARERIKDAERLEDRKVSDHVQMCRRVERDLELTHGKGAKVIASVLDAIIERLCLTGRCSLRGFGRFLLSDRRFRFKAYDKMKKSVKEALREWGKGL